MTPKLLKTWPQFFIKVSVFAKFLSNEGQMISKKYMKNSFSENFNTTCHHTPPYAMIPWIGPRSLCTCVSYWWRQNMLITAMISTAYIVSGVTFPFSSYFFPLLFFVFSQGVRMKMWNGWEWDVDTWPFCTLLCATTTTTTYVHPFSLHT